MSGMTLTMPAFVGGVAEERALALQVEVPGGLVGEINLSTLAIAEACGAVNPRATRMVAAYLRVLANDLDAYAHSWETPVDD